jgi:hypothetical protein
MSYIIRQAMSILGDPEERRSVFEFIRGDIGTPNELFDLNAVIPMPESVKKTLGFATIEAINKARQSRETFTEFEQRRHDASATAWIETGYDCAQEWAEHTWGAQCNVYAIERREEIGDLNEQLVFSSHRQAIFPVIKEISRLFPEIMVELVFGNEEERFVGRAHFVAGRGLCLESEWDSDSGKRIRSRLWGKGTEDVDDEVVDLTHLPIS